MADDDRFRLVGVMAYEGQIAGLPNNTGPFPRRAAVRGFEALSAQELKSRRARAVEAVREVSDLEFVNGGDEHGILRGGTGPLPALGDTVWLVPGHCDPTVNLHDHLVAVRSGLDRGQVEAVWPIEARGCVR